jgi:transketolase
MASGSELQLALEAAKQLGPGTRVVSMPCFARFDRQLAAYRDEVLPKSCRKRVAVEASIPSTWGSYVGLDGAVVGINRFGLSAPGGEVMKTLGITAAHVVETAKSL